MSNKLDLIKTYKKYYTAAKKPEFAKFDPANFLTVIGKGEPGEDEFSKMIEILYPVAYGVKKIYKNADKDFGVPKLEGLWWVEDNRDLRKTPKSDWCWKLLIRMPDFVTAKVVNQAKDEIKKKKKIDSQIIEFEKYCDNKCVQMKIIIRQPVK